MGQLTIVVDKMLRTLQADVNKEDLTASHCRNEFHLYLNARQLVQEDELFIL